MQCIDFTAIVTNHLGQLDGKRRCVERASRLPRKGPDQVIGQDDRDAAEVKHVVHTFGGRRVAYRYRTENSLLEGALSASVVVRDEVMVSRYLSQRVAYAHTRPVVSAMVEKEAIPRKSRLKVLTIVKVGICGRIRHHDVLLTGAYRVLVCKASGIFHVEEYRHVELHHVMEEPAGIRLVAEVSYRRWHHKYMIPALISIPVFICYPKVRLPSGRISFRYDIDQNIFNSGCEPTAFSKIHSIFEVPNYWQVEIISESWLICSSTKLSEEVVYYKFQRELFLV